MWNIVNSLAMGHSTSSLCGMTAAQKRSFSFNLANVAIAPGKYFENPNFVNKNNPCIYNFQNKCPPKVCHCDNLNEDNLKGSSVINSSQSITDIIKEKHFDIIQSQIAESKSNVQINVETDYKSKGLSTKSRRHRRRKSEFKNSQQQNCIGRMKDLIGDTEVETSLITSDIVNTVMPESSCFKDFLIESSNTFTGDSDQVDISDNANMTCSSPVLTREPLISVSESEDSFIVFENSTDQECDILEELQSTDDEEEDSEIDSPTEDWDSSSSVIPTKRVRFADDLCEVHPMIKWSFAYQQARKGPWEEYARDRDRFRRRIEDTERALSPALDSQHRKNIFKERFQNSEVC